MTRPPSPEVRTLAPLHLVGMHRSATLLAPAVREVWQAFRPRVAEIPNRASDDFVNMRIYDAPVGDGPRPDAPFEQWAAVEVEAPGEVPAGMEAVTLEGGDYAVFTYRGRADGFMDVARWFYAEWLPGSGYRVADRPHFERLGSGYRPDDPEATEEVWIPVEARGGG